MAFLFAATRGVLVVVAGIVQTVFCFSIRKKMFHGLLDESLFSPCQTGFQGSDGDLLLLERPLRDVEAPPANMTIPQGLKLHPAATHRAAHNVPLCLSAGRMVVLLAGG